MLWGGGANFRNLATQKKKKKGWRIQQRDFWDPGLETFLWMLVKFRINLNGYWDFFNMVPIRGCWFTQGWLTLAKTMVQY
jgi:hypothetical protein